MSQMPYNIFLFFNESILHQIKSVDDCFWFKPINENNNNNNNKYKKKYEIHRDYTHKNRNIRVLSEQRICIKKKCV